MSRARHKEHKERARGGGLSSEPKWNAGGEQNAAKEAEEKKRGGKVHHAEGESSKHRADKRARGGHVDGEAVHKTVKKHSFMHKGRARGGRIGSNLMPLSTAAKVKHITPGETPEEGGPHGSSAKMP